MAPMITNDDEDLNISDISRHSTPGSKTSTSFIQSVIGSWHKKAFLYYKCCIKCKKFYNEFPKDRSDVSFYVRNKETFQGQSAPQRYKAPSRRVCECRKTTLTTPQQQRETNNRFQALQNLDTEPVTFSTQPQSTRTTEALRKPNT